MCYHYRTKLFIGDSVLLQDVALGIINIPLHWIYLKSDLITGSISVDICPTFPTKEFSVLLSNDLTGGKVVADPIVSD